MLKALFSKPYSRLYIVGDNAGWSIDDDAKDLKELAGKLGIKAEIIKRAWLNVPQAVHYTSQFSLQYDIYKSNHRISVDYYHGKPEQQESFRRCFEALKSHHHKMARVRVSTKEMEALIKSSGIDPRKVARIPIGIDLPAFQPQTQSSKLEIRRKLQIPENAVVVGSFQKDGVGKGDGNEPKLIKGPDVFLEVAKNLKSELKNLHVLLSGPARGYMKSGLEKLGIPYTHKYFKDSAEVANLYDALDLYIITSREEGGPKACLQSMAKGVPLVTTAVGQCRDLVQSGHNAMMSEIDDVLGLTRQAKEVLQNQSLRETLVKNGFETAQQNSFQAQRPLWKEYFTSIVTSA